MIVVVVVIIIMFTSLLHLQVNAMPPWDHFHIFLHFSQSGRHWCRHLGQLDSPIVIHSVQKISVSFAFGCPTWSRRCGSWVSFAPGTRTTPEKNQCSVVDYEASRWRCRLHLDYGKQLSGWTDLKDQRWPRWPKCQSQGKNRHKMMCCIAAGCSGAPSHSSKGSPYIFAFCMFARGCLWKALLLYYVALCCTRQYGYCVLYCVSIVSIFGILDVNCDSIITDVFAMFVPTFLLVCSLSAVSTYNNVIVWKIYREKPQNLATDWAEFQPAFLYQSMLNEV